jgi:hypothetical protein
MACAIGSGIREFELMADLQNFDRDVLRTAHRRRWRDEVFLPNIAAARAIACHIRGTWGAFVIDPTHFDVPEFLQSDYDALCAEVIGTHARAVALAPGWQYSRGARAEVKLALAIGVPILDIEGNPFADECICEMAEEAESVVTAMGAIPSPGGPILLPSLDKLTV